MNRVEIVVVTLIILFVCGLLGFVFYQIEKDTASRNNFVVESVEHKNHKYLVFRRRVSSDRYSITHDPECIHSR